MAFGMVLRTRLPDVHLNAESKEVIRLGSSLLATLAALVLGLLIASAKNTYDTQNNNVRQLTAGIILLDQVMQQYGPETHDARVMMRLGLDRLTSLMWQQETGVTTGTPFAATSTAEQFYVAIEALLPASEAQRSLKPRIEQASTDVARARLLIFTQTEKTVPWPFLVVLIVWLTVIFTSFSLFVAPNPIVISALVIFALSVSCALFLILDLGQPFAGLMQISDQPLRHALAPL